MHTSRPDKPLVVKCTHDRRNKKISFDSARNCSYDILRGKVNQCFQLYASPYYIAYKDDDGEDYVIGSDLELAEAISYFQEGNDDPPISSTASILSGRSFGRSRITLRVDIVVEGPSLSDTSSLASMEEYKGHNGSEFSLSFSASPSADFEDDSVTVSSRDMGAGPSSEVQRLRQPDIPHPTSFKEKAPQLPSQMPWEEQSSSSWAYSVNSLAVDNHGDYRDRSASPSRTPQAEHISPFDDNYHNSAASRFPENPSAVFEQLKLSDPSEDNFSVIGYESSIAETDRKVAWLRDQNKRAFKSFIGGSPQPSVSDDASMVAQEHERNPEQMGGDLALRRDQRGKYYYSYTSVGSSGASQVHDSGYDDGPSVNDEPEQIMEEHASKHRPTSMQLNWLAAQQITSTESPYPSRPLPVPSSSRSLPHTSHSDPLPSLREHTHIDIDIPPEVLQYVPLTGPPPNLLTDCSECHVLLDSIRYVCSTCGEKKPVDWLADTPAKGKGKSTSYHNDPMAYPPLRHRNSDSSPTMSSTVLGGSSPSSSCTSVKHIYKPLPSLPNLRPSQTQTTLAPPKLDPLQHGYELCSGCIQSAGVNHTFEVNLAIGTSPGISGSPLGRGNTSPKSPEDAQLALSQLRRTAPGKGKLRHGYLEKVWGHKGWEDVEQDELHSSRCSTCNTTIINKRYKCASCPKFNICRACYSQVHEIHPSHAFLVVPDKPARSRSEPDQFSQSINDNNDEQSMMHCGVKCAHCMRDIIGARFHCAVCQSIDICSHCESAGLPGNLDSSDGGHNSSHIMIKIPYPLEKTEVQKASLHALALWERRDAPSVKSWAPHTHSKPSSVRSSYARTVVGSGSRDHSLDVDPEEDHHVACKGCGKPMIGIRYQCASCPSSPEVVYNLCGSCELRSYILHDPMHIFFKLPRPVQRPIESAFQMVPKLYKTPVGANGSANTADPRDYLKTLVHTAALCDRCMTRIQGEWFRCAYCAKDLCDACEALDTHDETHVFLVFKAPVDMQLFRMFADLENPNGGPPVIPYPIYR